MPHKEINAEKLLQKEIGNRSQNFQHNRQDRRKIPWQQLELDNDTEKKWKHTDIFLDAGFNILWLVQLKTTAIMDENKTRNKHEAITDFRIGITLLMTPTK